MDYYASGLTQLITVDVLDRASRVTIGSLRGVDSVSIEKNLYNDLRMGAQIGLDLRTPVSWRAVMLRVWITLKHNGEEQRFPLLTGVPKVGGGTRTDTAVRVTATVMDPTCLLDDIVGWTYAAPEGTNIAAQLRNIFAGMGIEAVIEDSTSTLRTPYSKPPDSTWREIVNGLGEALGYPAAWSDSMGVIHMEPYLDPGDRPETFKLGWGPRSVTLPEVELEYPDELPNHFVLTTADDDPLIAEGWNDDPDNPYSTVNQRMVPYYAEVEAADSWSLQVQLAAVMRANRDGVHRYTVRHRWVPMDSQRVLELQSAGRLNAPAHLVRGVLVEEALDTKVAITGQSFSWSKGEAVGHVTTSLRGA